MLKTNLSSVQSEEAHLTCFTMIPNWISDYVMVHENASVLKVVMFICRNTFGRTSQDGKRVEAVEASLSWMAQKLDMSERTLSGAIHLALEKGYILLVKSGRVAAGKRRGEGNWYSLNWNWSPLTEISYVKQEEGQTLSEKEGQFSPHKVAEEEQLLPEKEGQFSPPILNKAPELNKRVEINMRARRRNNSTSGENQKALEKAEKPDSSTTIGRLVSDFTREFGDSLELTLPNISRALNLWRKSASSEAEFVQALYQARQRTRQSGAIRHRRLAANGSSSDLPNRTPYFFAVLEELLSSPSRLAEETKKIPAIPANLARITPKMPETAEKIPANLPEVAQAEAIKIPAIPANLARVAEVARIEETPGQLIELEFCEEEPGVVPEEYVPVEDDWRDSVPVEAAANRVGAAIWNKVLAGMAGIAEAKKNALRRAELSQIEGRTRARFELKFARPWEKELFSRTDLFQLEMALGRTLGETIYELRLV